MSIEDIYNLLEGKMLASVFLNKYQAEIDTYANTIKKKASTVSIVIDDNYSFVFDKKHFSHLCNLFLQSKLSEIQINYVVDCLLLSEKIEFCNTQLLEILETFTDVSVNGHLTYNIVQSYLHDM